MIRIGFNLDDMQSELLCVRKNRRFVMRCTEERAHELVENAYSADQLTKFVHKYGLCDVCNFTGLDMSASRVIVNCVITVMYKYPCLRGSMCYIGSKKGYMVLLKNFSAYDEYTLKSLGVQHICDSNTAKSVGEAMISMLSEADKDSEANVLAQAVSGVGLLDGILLDENDFSTSRFLQIKKNLRQSVKSKFSPEGCDSVTSVIYHELGSCLIICVMLVQIKKYLSSMKKVLNMISVKRYPHMLPRQSRSISPRGLLNLCPIPLRVKRRALLLIQLQDVINRLLRKDKIILRSSYYGKH